MYTLVEVNSGNQQGTHVPAFLAKLWKLVDDLNTNDLIYWSEMGNSFIIRNQAKFARELLPLYYKHNNMASFVRQLNMYGFHKVVSVEQGGLKVDKDEMEFAHPFFLRGQESSLELIKRKIPTAKHDDSRGVRPDSLQKVLMDVRQMKGKQENIDSKLVTMKRENEALWRELASLRQKHAKQTQIVSKLLQFLVGMMSSQTHRLGFKRRMPLMLSEADGVKDRKHGRTEGQNLSGPVIRDVTEIFEADDSDDDAERSDYLTGGGGSGSDGDNLPQVVSPQSASGKSPNPESILGINPESEIPDVLLSDDPAIVNPSIANILNGGNSDVVRSAKAKPSRKASNKKTAESSSSSVSLPQMTGFSQAQLMPQQSAPNNTQPTPKATVCIPDDLDGHLDDMQVGLDNLKDILKGDDYKMDHSTLLGLFGDAALGNFDLTKHIQDSQPPATTTVQEMPNLSGQEMVSYHPSLFELTEDDSQFFDDSSNAFLDDELDSMLTTDRNRLIADAN